MRSVEYSGIKQKISVKKKMGWLWNWSSWYSLEQQNKSSANQA
jgi:hypothetical protein